MMMELYGVKVNNMNGMKKNKMSPCIDVKMFNKNKVSEEFIKSCKIAAKLFGKERKIRK